MRTMSLAWQLIVSAGVGVLAAFCVFAIYMAGVMMIDADEGQALLGPFCVFPIMLCLGSFASGRVLRCITDQRQVAVKSFLATPAFYEAGSLIVYTAIEGHLSEFWRTSWLPTLIPCIVCWPLTYLGFHRRRVGKALDEPPLCTKCDYNLTGNVSGICPECGTPIPGFNERPKQGVEIEP